MIRTASLFGVLALALTVSLVNAGGAVKSGPQVGQDVPGPFHPLNVNGANAGKKHCLYCQNGGNPVAVVFAREVTPAVANLIAKLDEATVKNKGASMGSYAVFCSDKETVPAQLKELAEKSKLQSLVLSVDNPAGPKDYSIAKDADVTVLLYNNYTVRANHSFRAGELRDADVARIVADVTKITEKK
jgi:hypothetical protein